MPENHSAKGRLDSWKEIAEYLKRDVRTVIRWERDKALPVHRVPGGQRKAVFAYTHEVDAWLLGQSAGNDTVSPAAATTGPARPEQKLPSSPESDVSEAGPGPLVHTLKAWKLPVFAIGLLAMAWVIYAVLVPHNTLRIRPLSIRKVTDDGHVKGGMQTDGTTLYFVETRGARAVLMSAPLTGGSSHAIDTPFSNVSLQGLSNDGKTLLILSYEGIIIEGPLWTIAARGGTPRRLGNASCNFARWSPDNRRIACARRTAVTVMDADGSNQYTVASFAMPVSQVIWTPDGNRLRYVLADTLAHTLSQWEIEAAPRERGAPARELALGPGCCLDWTWAPDGSTFFYTALDADGKTHLMAQSGASGSVTELPVNIGVLWPVVAGKTDNTLYLAITDAPRGELLKFDVQRGSLESVLTGLSAEYLSFSRDGQWMSYTDSGGGSLWRSHHDGTHAMQVVGASMSVQVSSWSPDGRRIAFMGKKPRNPFRIYLIDRDGGAAEEASEGNDNQGGPSWSPDGKFIVYGNVFCEMTQNCWVRRIDLATHKSEILRGSNGLRTARWSPDGKYIAALRFQTHELMLFDVRSEHWKTLADSVNGDNISWSSDSEAVYVDSPRDEKPVVERVRIKDGHRSTVISLASLQQVSGIISPWIGLAPDNSPILNHILTASEIYELKWTDQ